MSIVDYAKANAGVILRAACYFGGSFLLTIADKLGPILTENQWPSAQHVCWSLILATGAGTTATVAYFDGSSRKPA